MDSKKTAYRGVKDLFKEYANKEEQKEFEQFIDSQQIAKTLFALRSKAGKTQKELAEKAGMTQSKISKIEHAFNDDLSVGDILKYSSALGLQLHIGFTPENLALVNQVKLHWFQLLECLDEIQKLSEGDKEMETEARKFSFEAANNILNGLLEHLTKVHPENMQKPALLVTTSDIESTTKEDCDTNIAFN